MPDGPFDKTSGRDLGEVANLLAKISQLLERQTAVLLEQDDLARQRTDTTSHLALHSLRTADQAEKQTGFAQERTALTREQTRLSTRSAELANIRTGLAQERVHFAEERTRLAARRTEMAHRRTAYSGWRTKLAEQRNDFARERNGLAITRTRLSLGRTELAKGRTYLALIRTGLAFLTVGLTLFRYFGVSLWTLFDAALVLSSGVMVYFGVVGFRRVRAIEMRLTKLVAADRVIADAVEIVPTTP